MKKSYLTYLFPILVLFASCSSNLEKTEATDLITKLPNEVVKGNIEIWLSASSYHKDIEDKFNNKNSQLIQRGILTNPNVSETKSGGFLEPNTINVRTNFTDSAQALILGGGNEPYQSKTFIVKCGELKFVEVVDIFQDDKNKTAEIEFKVAFTPTMFAGFAKTESSYEKGMSYTRKKTAKKYDSGWKIE